MTDDVRGVIAGERRWAVVASDALAFLQALPERSLSMVLTSPPYEAARTYSIGFKRSGQDWVDWLAPIIVEACRACNGLVFLNAAGQLRNYSYSPVVEWLVTDLTRLHGVVCGPAPYCYFRHGVPGSGGRHYHRRDWEPLYAFALPDRLPPAFSDNTALGHPPRWAPGGEMSNRLSNGTRCNQWGRPGMTSRKTDGTLDEKGRPSHDVVLVSDDTTPGLFGLVEPEQDGPNVNQWGGDVPTRKKDGTRQPPGRPSHVTRKQASTSRRQGTDERKDEIYDPPVIANPGNVIRERYPLEAEEVRQLLMGGDLGGPVMQGSPGGDVIRCLVGGGLMGSKKAHDSEAPFSEVLCEYLIRSYAAPDSVVCDPFSGSGSVAAVAVRWGRRFVGCDIRESQTKIARQRVEGETLPLPGMEG